MAINTNTDTWLTIRAHCVERLESLRQKLEADISHDDSIKVRAQIKELRGIISLGETEPPLTEPAEPLPE